MSPNKRVKKRRRNEPQANPVAAPRTVTRYTPGPYEGLTADQVRKRMAQGLDNHAIDPPSKTVKEIIKGNVFTYFNYIFLLISILPFLVGAYREMLFLPIIILNALIGIIQELQAKKSPAKLLLQVHDELIFECPDNQEIINQTIDLIRDKMENAVKLLVKLEVDLQVGKTWYDTK